MTFDHFHEPIQHDTTSSCNPWLHSRLLQKLFASLLSYIFPTPQNLSRYSTVLHLPMWCMSKCQGMLKRPRWRGDMHPLSRWRVSVGVRWIGVIMWRREVRCDSRQQVATTVGFGACHFFGGKYNWIPEYACMIVNPYKLCSLHCILQETIRIYSLDLEVVWPTKNNWQRFLVPSSKSAFGKQNSTRNSLKSTYLGSRSPCCNPLMFLGILIQATLLSSFYWCQAAWYHRHQRIYRLYPTQRTYLAHIGIQ